MTHNIAIYIEPTSHHFSGNRLFIANDGRRNGDRINEPFVYLRDFFAARGITVQTADYLPERESNIIKIYVSMGWLNNYRAISRRSDTVLSAVFAMECPIVDPALYRELGRAQQFFRRVFSWSDSQSIQHFVGKPLNCRHYCWPQSFDDVHEDIWNKTNRKFLVMINSNRLPLIYWNELYTKRLQALDFFSRTGDIDLYGNGWDETPFPMHRKWVPYTFRFAHHAINCRWDQIRPNPLLQAARRAYRGPTPSKSDTLGHYKFALCFENMILKGWISEKIFDCFFAGTIPVYWGAPDIDNWVPPECFVDMRLFSGYQELKTFLKSLSEKDIRNYKNAARHYLRSSQFRPFSKQAFAELFQNIVEVDAGIHLSASARAYQ